MMNESLGVEWARPSQLAFFIFIDGNFFTVEFRNFKNVTRLLKAIWLRQALILSQKALTTFID
jgi:hypothetical protein